MSNVKAAYPNSVFTWTDKIDQQDIDFANDINSTVAEVISLENTLGTNPQIEPNPPTGTPVTYSSVSARISDAMSGKELPVGILSSSKQVLGNTTVGVVNTYRASYDPYNMFNGVDLTIPSNGWWYVSASQTWTGWSDGYSHLSLCLNGTTNIVDDALINWEFPGNGFVLGVAQRWSRFGTRAIITTCTWQGLAHKGDRFSGLSENGTSNASHTVTNLTMKASMLRKITGTFTSG